MILTTERLRLREMALIATAQGIALEDIAFAPVKTLSQLSLEVYIVFARHGLYYTPRCRQTPIVSSHGGIVVLRYINGKELPCSNRVPKPWSS